MLSKTIRLLHVEDEESQRRLFDHHLRHIDGLRFEVVHADSEEAAVEIFRAGGVSFVVLDYNLHQGNGLQCLERIRQEDPIVPIIAISGVATDEIAADLVQAGADDYISKRDLTSGILARSMRDSLSRVAACRKRAEDSRS